MKRILSYNGFSKVFVSTSEPQVTLRVNKADYYTIALVGGGSGGGHFDAKWYGGWSNWRSCAGASGAAFQGDIYLEANVDYRIVVGQGGNNVGGRGTSQAGGDSILYDLRGNAIVTASGGTSAGNAAYQGTSVQSKGGKVTIHQPSLVKNITLNKSGNDGTYNLGNDYGPSVWDGSNTGVGAGGTAWADGDDRAWSNKGMAGLVMYPSIHKCNLPLMYNGKYVVMEV